MKRQYFVLLVNLNLFKFEYFFLRMTNMQIGYSLTLNFVTIIRSAIVKQILLKFTNGVSNKIAEFAQS